MPKKGSPGSPGSPATGAKVGKVISPAAPPGGLLDIKKIDTSNSRIQRYA
jgi:hypothetical protein